MKYRSDIDGLRAVAVLSVVFYHAGLAGFAGGFVGVDIFFVISGYLITGIILQEQPRRFSIVQFYERRVRRILPALFTVLAGTSAIAFLVMLPSDAVGFAKSVVATIIFLSNVEFWKESRDYFGATRDSLPLLHTWSLGVEEQFYILYPLLLDFLRHRLPKQVPAILLSILLLSLGLNFYGISHFPAATFFLAPTRAWELLLGALLALGIFPRLNNKPMLDGFALAGAALILFAIAQFNDKLPYPGLYAVVPCAGAALMIFANGQNSNVVSRVLSFKPLVYIGLISYSLYLVHWPVFVFAHYFALRPLTSYEVAILIFICFVLAILSYHYVEKPFRKPSGVFTRKKLFAAACAAAALFSVLSGAAIYSSGFPERFNSQVKSLNFYAARERNEAAYHIRSCFLDRENKVADYQISSCLSPQQNKINVLVWGDSHAAHFVPGLEYIAPQNGLHVMEATYGGCPPMTTGTSADVHVCAEFNDMVLRHVNRSEVNLVILASFWSNYAADTNQADLLKLVAELRQRGVPILMLGPSAAYNYSVVDLLARRFEFSPEAARQRVYVSGEYIYVNLFQENDEMQRRFSNMPGVHYASVLDGLCPNRSCLAALPNGIPMQWDYGHLTVEGSRYVASNILSTEIKRALP